MFWTTLLRMAMPRVLGPLPVDGADTGRGLVIVADGVGGLDLCSAGLRYAVAKAGARHVVRPLRWGHGFGRWHRDLTSTTRHAEQAARLVEQVLDHRRDWPGAPVYLVGKSGGSGLVVRALEQLPPGGVEAAVLLAPAISPRYDLTLALRALRGEMTVFWSPLDAIVLGAGTSIFGTVDRVRTPAAGLVGFRPPPGADPADYARLRQVRWHWRMGRTGYFGGHVGPDLPGFLRLYVLPLMTLVNDREAPTPAGSSPAQAPPIT